MTRTVSLVDAPILTGCTCGNGDLTSGPASPTVTVTFTLTEIHAVTLIPEELCGVADGGYEKGWEARSGAVRLEFGRPGVERRNGRDYLGRVGKPDKRRKWSWFRTWR